MSYRFPPRRIWRGLAATTAASVALVVVGCASDQPSQSYWGNGQGTPAAQTSSNTSGQRARTASEQDQRRAVENAMYFPSGKRDGSQLMVQQIGPREVRVGQEYNYQLRVTNLTNAPLTGVMLHERVPQDLKLASDQGRENDGQVRINVGDLGPGESKVIQMSGTPSNPGTIDTCVSAQFNPPTLCTHVAVVAPQIRITAEGPSQADVCQDLMYRYTVTNTGTGTAHNVVLQENLPDGVQTTDGQRNFSINVGDLGQGQSKTVTARLRAKQPGQFTTRAIAQSDAGKAESEQVATNVLAPRLQVTVSGPRDAFMGEPLAYQVTVKNVGDAAAADTRVRLGATPGHVEFVNAEGAQGAQLASEREGTGQNLGNIAPGEARTITVNFKSIQGGPMSVEATAQARCAQDVSTSVNTNLKTITASTLIVTHDPDPVPVGQNVTYHITIENKGTAPDHNVRVTAQIPDGEQFVSANGQTSATNSGQTVTFGPIDTLQPKQSMHWTVVAKAMQPQEVQFKTTLASEATPQTSVKLEPTKMFGIERGTETRTNTAQPQQQPNQEQKQTPPQNNDFNK